MREDCLRDIRYWLLGMIFLGLAGSLPAQSGVAFSNLRTKRLSANLPHQLLDSLSIMPSTLSLKTESGVLLLEFVDYRLYSNNQILLDTAEIRRRFPECQFLTARFRVLPFSLNAPIRRLDTLSIRRRQEGETPIEFEYTPYQPGKQAWESAGLQSSGAYTRGLSFGNSQNLVFNSNLNLQLNGKLGNDLELQAVLSDNSVPLQPDGSTRQLQEFDRIFIQIKRKNVALIAGDYDLTKPKGHFSQYFKRLQGGMVLGSAIGAIQNSLRQEKRPGMVQDTLHFRVAAAISKGKFARQSIQGQEGNQGPYRLNGAEGERFIIVLAGTEKVYMDGELLQRGLDADYSIDYNLGEVSFTPRRLLTKDKRILIEFEYAVQNFLRSTLASNWTWNRPGASVYLNLYSEQDSRSPSSAQDLSSAERQSLAQAGDQFLKSYASGVDTLTDFDSGRILYKYVDSLVCGIITPILVYSTQPDSARFAARFTEVLPGQGNYVLISSSANGRVFKWVAPDPVDCKPRGNFEPIVRLLAPERRQLFSLGTEVKPFKNGLLRVETALSSRDYNRFSPLDDKDNYGGALMADLNQGIKLSPSFQSGIQVNYERTAKHFQALNPYRPAEFIRNWNSDLSKDTVSEQLARAGVWMSKDKLGRLNYEFGTFQRQDVYQGYRHQGQMNSHWKGLEIQAEGNLLQTSSLTETTRFVRPKLDLSYLFSSKDSSTSKKTTGDGFLRIGFYAEREKNERRYTGADTLSKNGFWYDLYRLYWQMPDERKAIQLGGQIQQRQDFFPSGNAFKLGTEAREMSLNGRWDNALSAGRTIKPVSQRLNWTLSLRKLRVLAPESTTLEAQNTYLGRLDYNFSALKNALNLGTGYELGSGQSPKIEFNYLKVNPGEGQYSWIDRNQDSILQVDEMEIAVFQDLANYLRVAVTTQDYIRTNNLVFSQNLRLEPRLLWPNPKSILKKTLKRLSTLSSLQINRRTFANSERVEAWNPFAFNIPDSALVTDASYIRNSLFINRADPVWDASVSQNLNSSQFVLTSGYERRQNKDWNVHLRGNIKRKWSLEADAVLFQKSSNNEAFSTRDFDIRGLEAGPKLSWTPTRNFRLSLSSSWKSNANQIGAKENSSQLKIQQELAWNPQSKVNAQGFKANTAVRLKFALNDIQYNGAANTSVAFSMLEGLQNGKNYLWSLNFDRQISKSLQLSLNYEGRKTGTGGRLVQVGRAQVRAVL